jgi:hypothetical protein
MLAPKGDSFRGPALKPGSNTASGANASLRFRGIHRGGENAFSVRIRPPAPAHSPLHKFAVKLCSHVGSTVKSSSVKASISPFASRTPLLSACDLPDLGSNRYRKCAGSRWQKLSATSRVASLELLSIINTSHATDSGSTDAARLSSVFARLWLRLNVHRITEIFTASPHLASSTSSDFRVLNRKFA